MASGGHGHRASRSGNREGPGHFFLSSPGFLERCCPHLGGSFPSSDVLIDMPRDFFLS